MDISDTLVAKSDQLNASDLSGGPITVVVESVDVVKNNPQPVHIHLVGMRGRPYKPSKGMRRVIAQAWGPDSDAYVGRSMTLYRNPEVRYAGEKVGGIEISAMSHLDKPLTTSVRENSKVARPHVVQPLKVASAKRSAPTEQTGEIPAEVIENVKRAKADGNLGSYLAWLEDNRWPEHIVAYVKDQEGKG